MEREMKFLRRDDGPTRVLERRTEVEWTPKGHKSTKTSVRVFTGSRKALR